MDTWDIFIAYHGSYDDTGSKKRAKEISDWLKSKGIRAYFFSDDESDRFGDTPAMASYSTLFLLVANQNITVNFNGEASGIGLCSELRAFYNKKVFSYTGRHTLARVYCYDQCTAIKANDFHIMFNNVDHFEEKRDGETLCLNKLYEWIISVKNEVQNHIYSSSELKRFGYLNLDFSSQFLQLPHPDNHEHEQMLLELSELYTLTILGEFIDSEIEKNNIVFVSVPSQWTGFHIFRFIKKTEALKDMQYIIFCKSNSNGIICYDIEKNSIYSCVDDLYIRFKNANLVLSNQKYNLSLKVSEKNEISFYSFQGYETEIEYKEYECNGECFEGRSEYYIFSYDWKYALEKYSIFLGVADQCCVDESLVDIEDSIVSAIKNACHNIISCKSFYNDFRSTSKLIFGSQFDEPAYKEITLEISDFCQRKDATKLRNALSSLWNLYENATSYYEKENLLLLFSEIVIYNIFTLDEDYVIKYDLFGCLMKQAELEILPHNKLRCMAFCCFIAKEMLFAGNFKVFAPTFKEACEYILKQYDNLRQVLEEMLLICKDKGIIDELLRINLFLYRQRAVIWEELGDEEFDNLKKKHFYELWKQDSLTVIEIFKDYSNADKEIVGCAYLNYASALNRFSQFEPDIDRKRDMLNDCLENLEKAERLLYNISVQRLIGYVYLHKADCYVELAHLFPDDTQNYNNALLHMSMKADNIFKRTDDYNARGWALRIMAKGKMKLIGSSVNAARECLMYFRQSLQFSLKTYNANVMLCCICDLTIFMHLIKDNNMMDELYDDFKKLFADELMAFSNIIRQVEITTDRIFEIQEILYEIYMSKENNKGE